MAANKFATMLHRKTNKLTLVLVYTFLEWLLIFFLLLNSLFSYLIIKFAHCFGLQKPCLWCCRLDHLFEPSNSHRSLVCETHAVEISKLGYCSNHRKLAESQDMCEDCSSSGEASKKFVFFPWMNKLGVLQEKASENAVIISKCSCCGVGLAKTPDDFVVKPFWGDSENSPKENVILDDETDLKTSDLEDEMNKNREEKTEERVAEESDREDFVMEKGEEEPVENEEDFVRVESRDMSSEIRTQHLEFYIDQDACHLIPIDSKKPEDDEDFVMEFEKQYELVLERRSSFEEKVPLLPILECEEEEEEEEEEAAAALISGFEIEQFPTECLKSAVEEMGSLIIQESEAEIQVQMDETEAEISIGTEIPDHETMEHVPSDGSKQDEQQHVEVEFQSINVAKSEPEMSNHLLLISEKNETEEEKIPNTPNSAEKKFSLLERRESSVEESIDGSVASDIEGGDGVVTVEKLKSALKAERKALNDLYAELEEERSASAVAASQTMAMINRLQEEKAAMQMEALQYQRMMEEQSEYDHEALQLMNELMVKRERERAELERELDLYRKRVEEYETRVKRRKSSASGEESDVDLNHKTKDENGFGPNRENSNQNTPVDDVFYLEDSLAGFEEERISILDQLRVLEERLFTLSESDENGNGYNDHFEANGKVEKRLNGVKAKRLLPLFDEAVEEESENGHKDVAIEEEVERVYERLQALEEDREFLKHCMASLQKGDKGIRLLEEILQHLRDLRYVETRARTMENGLAYSL